MESYKQAKVYLPVCLYLKMEKIAKERGIPVNRLFCYAVYNELELKHPFNFPMELPNDLIQDAYAAEAGKLYRYLEDFPKGLTLDNLIMRASDVGLDRKSLLGAFAQLKSDGLLEQIAPNQRGVFNYPKELHPWRLRETEIRHARITKETPKPIERIAHYEVPSLLPKGFKS